MSSESVAEKPLGNWKLLEQFRRRLKSHLEKASKSATEQDPRCKLIVEDYFCLILCGLFNPALKTMRALCHASGQIDKMRQICSAPMRPSSFSAAQHVVDPEILAGVLRELAQEVKGRKQFGDARVREAIQALTLVDGTVLRAVNRMIWAPAGGHGCAIKLHLHFSVFDQVPEDWTITAGNVCERKTWKRKIQRGAFYVADRLYSDDHRHLQWMMEQQIDFVLRLPDNVHRTPVGEARTLTTEDRLAGVVSDRLEHLGCKENGPVVRVVEIEVAGKTLVLITSRLDLPAAIIGLIYRYRWQIELFFKWFKVILGFGHWLAESSQGVAIQLYSALIASLLLFLLTSERPNKRQMETLRLYFVGFASEEELLRELKLKKM